LFVFPFRFVGGNELLDAGARYATGGGVPTVKREPALEPSLVVTTTLPLPAPIGSVATIWVSDQFFVLAVTRLKVTEFPVADDPKECPWIVTSEPISPIIGLRDVIDCVVGGSGVGALIPATSMESDTPSHIRSAEPLLWLIEIPVDSPPTVEPPALVI
jgi:hypothetical protein